MFVHLSDVGRSERNVDQVDELPVNDMVRYDCTHGPPLVRVRRTTALDLVRANAFCWVWDSLHSKMTAHALSHGCTRGQLRLHPSSCSCDKCQGKLGLGRHGPVKRPSTPGNYRGTAQK
jgi:hypothetical protein